ncbi:uncharacterized protein V1518DRAFT_419585 [Limtongia smithiae]|uniref:uncharacterized protein n=1 Tax=Limtongia smithiae TaxID=1125753 RepID=UPI0034CD0FD9
MARTAKILGLRRKRPAAESSSAMVTKEQAEHLVRAQRAKCVELLEQGFVHTEEHDEFDIDNEALHQLCELIEQEIFTRTGRVIGPRYRSAITGHKKALMERDNAVRVRVLQGQVSPQEFARMGPADLASDEQRRQDDEMRQYAMRQKIKAKVGDAVVSSIRDVKDGRERGHWGVTTSASAVDDF